MFKKILKCTVIFTLFSLLFGINAFAGSKSLTGAGSSFLYPAMSIWTEAYYNKTDNKINYQAIGSGAGISMLLLAQQKYLYYLIRFQKIIGWYSQLHRVVLYLL